MTRPIVNIDELDVRPRPVPVTGPAIERFEASFARIGPQIGARQLGYNITVVPPGKRAFPYHCHHANEEMFFILEGGGEIRIGDERHPIRKGDFIACPTGGPETAHQIINTGSDELRYLAVSTQRGPEMWQYPDSGKFGIISEMPSMGGTSKPFFARMDNAVEYWDGE